MGDPSRVRVTGPLEAYASGFATELTRVGYRKNSTADQLRLLAHLSGWLAAEGRGAAELTPAVGDAFLVARRALGYTLWLSRKALVPLLQYLRELGAAPQPPAVVPTPIEEMLARYRGYLTSERGLTASAAQGYAYAVRPFCANGRHRRAGSGSRIWPHGTSRLSWWPRFRGAELVRRSWL